jgi:hypothetical protein
LLGDVATIHNERLETTMARLTPKEFRIQNNRNIEDSDWIPIETVTALVGRNESGKTALLKALHKFNPATPQPYVPQREFPRDRFTRDFRNPRDWPVSSVKFGFDDELRRAAIAAPAEAPALVVVTRFYDGFMEYAFEPDWKEPEIPPGPLLAAIETLSNAVMRPHTGGRCDLHDHPKRPSCLGDYRQRASCKVSEPQNSGRCRAAESYPRRSAGQRTTRNGRRGAAIPGGH